MDNVIATITEGDRTEPSVTLCDTAESMSLDKGNEIQTGDNAIEEVATSTVAEIKEQATSGEVDAQKNHILGKFDNVEMLQDAYKSLQAEFTRKSQELANLKRMSKGSNLQNALDNFVEYSRENKLDEKLINEVAQKFLDDETLKDDKFGLTQAVYRAMSDRMEADARNLQSDDWVYELVNSRENIKQKIINEYINNCTNGNVPPLIVNTYGANMVASTPNAPTTLEEVANIMNKWLN